MATYDNSYSRFIAWAKIILPLLALAILSTLFLFSRNIGQTDRLPYSDVEIEELAREPRISAPNYSGVTEDGAALSIFAEVARPDPDNSRTLHAETLSAQIDTPGGLHIDVDAQSGTVDGTAEQATLEGDVMARTSTGYSIRTDRLTAAMEGTLLQSDRPLQVDGPFGTLDANAMELRRNTTDQQSYLLVFKDGVKLVYQP